MVTTWSLNFQHIEQVNPAAAERLRLCAFLEPDAIPEELLMEARAFRPLQLRQAAADPFLFGQMIGELLAFSLVKRVVSDHMLSIHRLVQAVIRDMLTWEEQQVWTKRVIQATSTLFPEKAEFATWDRCRRYLPQAQHCASLIEDFEFAFEQAGSLLSRMATYLYHYALYDHPEVALSLLRLGMIHMHQGKHPQAEAYCLRAWQIWEQARGPNHPESASVLDQLGNAYVSQGEYEKAEQCYVQALHIREQAPGPDHFNMATLQNNLGNVYVAQQKYEQAEPLFHRARHIWEQALPPDHLYLAYPLAGLGDIYVRQKKYEQAEPLLQRAPQIWEQTQEQHPDSVEAFEVLARLRNVQGRRQGALSTSVHCLSRNRFWELSTRQRWPCVQCISLCSRQRTWKI